MVLKKMSLRRFTVFLLFIGISGLLWILNKYSRTYKEYLEVSIVLDNIPQNWVVSNNKIKAVGITETNGFLIQYRTFFPEELHIDASKFMKQENELYYLESNDILMENRRSVVNELIDDKIFVDASTLSQKRVPVRANIHYKLAQGFGVRNDSKRDTDSVTLYGAYNVLSDVQYVTTDSVFVDKVNEDVFQTLTLHVPSEFIDQKVKLKPNALQWTLDVERITQGSVTIPVEIVNLPEGVDMKVYPKNGVVQYTTLLEDFSKVSDADFRLVIDYQKLDLEQTAVIPQLSLFKNVAINERVSPSQFQIVIIQ